MNILIADAGSTKVDWVLLDRTTGQSHRYTGDGLNALLADESTMTAAFNDVAAKIGDVHIDEIHYYGAGCATDTICSKTRQALLNSFPGAEVSVTSDLLGASRALLGHSKGIACILGTGSNSCLYDGVRIVANTPSLGFILGDEGSGAALGKRLVADAFKGHLPENIKQKFLDTYKLSLSEILDKVYRKPAPNKFLASLVPFISDHLWNPYIYSLVLQEFKSFMSRNLAMYPGVHSLPVSFTGSIAYHFEPLLREAAASQGLMIGRVEQNPIDGLIAFHSQETANP